MKTISAIMKADPYVISLMKMLKSFLEVMNTSMMNTNIVTYPYENVPKFTVGTGMKSLFMAPVHSKIASRT